VYSENRVERSCVAPGECEVKVRIALVVACPQAALSLSAIHVKKFKVKLKRLQEIFSRDMEVRQFFF
jgi:hypothetical protein